jgi:hypothetical protein
MIFGVNSLLKMVPHFSILVALDCIPTQNLVIFAGFATGILIDSGEPISYYAVLF